VAGFDESGYPVGFLCARTERFLEWGHDVFETYLDRDGVEAVQSVDEIGLRS